LQLLHLCIPGCLQLRDVLACCLQALFQLLGLLLALLQLLLQSIHLTRGALRGLPGRIQVSLQLPNEILLLLQCSSQLLHLLGTLLALTRFQGRSQLLHFSRQPPLAL